MIWTLFKHDLKENKILILSFTAILLLYGMISVSMFSPESAAAMEGFLDSMPEAMINMMGFDILGGEITAYVANYLYGFIMLIFPIIFLIMLGSKLINRHVDTGSMQFIMTTPYSRIRIALTQAIFFAVSLIFVLVFNIIAIMLLSEAMFPGTLDYDGFLMLNFVTLSIHLLLAGVVFFFSAFFNDASYCLGTSSGLLFAFFILNMLRKLGEETEFLKYFTLFSLIDIDHILAGGGNGLWAGILTLLSAVVVFASAIIYFDKKSLII